MRRVEVDFANLARGGMVRLQRRWAPDDLRIGELVEVFDDDEGLQRLSRVADVNDEYIYFDLLPAGLEVKSVRMGPVDIHVYGPSALMNQWAVGVTGDAVFATGSPYFYEKFTSKHELKHDLIKVLSDYASTTVAGNWIPTADAILLNGTVSSNFGDDMHAKLETVPA